MELNSIFNNTPLFLAVKKSHTDIVQILLSHPGIEINCKDIRLLKSFIQLQLKDFIIFQC